MLTRHVGTCIERVDHTVGIAIFGLGATADRWVVAALARMLGAGVFDIAHAVVVRVDGRWAAAARRQRGQRASVLRTRILLVREAIAIMIDCRAWLRRVDGQNRRGFDA